MPGQEWSGVNSIMEVWVCELSERVSLRASIQNTEWGQGKIWLDWKVTIHQHQLIYIYVYSYRILGPVSRERIEQQNNKTRELLRYYDITILRYSTEQIYDIFPLRPGVTTPWSVLHCLTWYGMTWYGTVQAQLFLINTPFGCCWLCCANLLLSLAFLWKHSHRCQWNANWLWSIR